MKEHAMNGLGGLNPSAQGVVIGLVQLQLPVVETPQQLASQTQRICDLVGKARRNLSGMDLVVFPEYALHGLSMNTDPALMCSLDGPEVAAFKKACQQHHIWGCFSIMELNPGGNKLLFRDKRKQLYLYNLKEQKKQSLLNYCKYISWVPNSDVVVA